MKTYAHLGVGLVIGQIAFSDNILSQAIVAGASCINDVPVAIMLIIDKAKNRHPLKQQSRLFQNINGAIHSLILWLPSILILPVFLGVYSHLLVDLISHSDERFAATDPSMFWPLRIKKVRGLFDCRRESGMLFDAYSVALMLICLATCVMLRIFM